MSGPRLLLVSPRAAADMDDICDYIAHDNPQRAITFVAELEVKCRLIAQNPDIYPARPDLAPALRMAVHGRYLVLYRNLNEQNIVRIERVLHSARNLVDLH